MFCKVNCRIWIFKWLGKGRSFVNFLLYWFIFFLLILSLKKENLIIGINLLKFIIILNYMKFLKKLYAYVCN